MPLDHVHRDRREQCCNRPAERVLDAVPSLIGYWDRNLVNQVANRGERALSSSLAQQFFGLDENQLVCLLFSPFIHHGERLEGYLRQCHPGMLVALPELHKVLQGKPAAEMLQQWVADASGLPLPLLQHLYRKRPMNLAPGGARNAPVQRSQARDGMAFQLSGR